MSKPKTYWQKTREMWTFRKLCLVAGAGVVQVLGSAYLIWRACYAQGG